MGILRSDIISHSQLPDGNQSVEFDGTGDYLQVPASEAWDIGRANRPHKAVTIEWWIYLNSLSSHTAFGVNQLSGIVAYGSNGRYAVYGGGQTLINESNSVLDAVGLNEWHHYALVLHPGPAGGTKNVEFYRDGKLSVSSTYAANVGLGVDSTILSIGADAANNSGFLNGFISNFRWSQEVVYKSEFTVPKFKLKALPSTMLLCCQSSTSVTEAAVSVTGSVTSNGDPAVSAFGPGLKDDITDTGVVFDGFGTFATSTYMVPPSGKTTERNRGRGVFAGGYAPSPASLRNIIDYVEIQTTGNAIDFGDLLSINNGEGGACSSSTRALFGGGQSNIVDITFITIANTSNVTDFGDLITGRRSLSAVSSDTKGLFAGGTTPAMKNEIESVTIATTGNASDFGDLTVARRNMAPNSSSTRGVFAGGNPGSGPLLDDTIDFVTIASAGNATDFGNLITAMREQGGSSSATRGLIAGGFTSPANLNTIEFITIATTGNASDFGDLHTAVSGLSGTSNGTRGIFAGGAYINNIQYVTIASTGNAEDFGDLTAARFLYDGTSDSHGGLS